MRRTLAPTMRRRVCGRGTLYWYPKQKPSEDMSNITGFGSLESSCVAADTVVMTVRKERSRTKVVAAARAMVRRSRRQASE
jgi:hypothetical protein